CRLRRGRPGGRRERSDEPTRLPRRPRPCVEAEDGRGAAGRDERAGSRAGGRPSGAGARGGARAGHAGPAARRPPRLVKRLRLAAAAALAVAAGTARADDGPVLGFTTSAMPSSSAVSLPSAATPNAPGSISVPVNFTVRPALTQQLTVARLEPLWQRAAAAYGVPWQVLAAINKIESNFGQNMGPSSAGAIGWMQFMPGTWLRWGVDANGDGIADPWNAADAIFAAARYLAATGGQTNISRAVFAYNHADWYVNEVLQLANVFGNGGPTVTANLQQLQAALDTARNRVIAA